MVVGTVMEKAFLRFLCPVDAGKRVSVDVQLITPIEGDEQFGPVIAAGPEDAIHVAYANRDDHFSHVLTYYLKERRARMEEIAGMI